MKYTILVFLALTTAAHAQVTVASCNGSNDTAAIQSALTASAEGKSDYYAGPLYQPVILPAGFCMVTNLVMLPGQSLKGQGQSATILAQHAASAGPLVEVSALTLNNKPYAPQSWAFFQDMTLDGNAGGQATANDVVHFDDSPNTSYDAAGKFLNITIVNGSGNGIYAGVNRNNGYLTDSLVIYNKGDGVQNKSYDWFATGAALGSNGGHGWNQALDGCTNFTNTSSWSNVGYGVYLAPTSGCYFTMVNGSLDRNHIAPLYDGVSPGHVDKLIGVNLTGSVVGPGAGQLIQE